VKYSFLLILLVTTAFSAQAGGYYSGASIDAYDKDTGLYFKSVKNGKEDGGFLSKGSSSNVSDINVFNPSTGKSTLIFGDNKPRKITTFLYESEYVKETQSIAFGTNERTYNVKNNNSIEEREIRNRLLIVVYDEEKEKSEMWSSDKSGNNLKKIKSFSKGVSWHIDVKNSKIRFVTSLNYKLNIESMAW